MYNRMRLFEKEKKRTLHRLLRHLVVSPLSFLFLKTGEKTVPSARPVVGQKVCFLFPCRHTDTHTHTERER